MNEKIKIVYAEDERVLRQSMSRMLFEEGIEVVAEAENGVQLLSVLKTVRPDLVLLDIQMKVMNGSEALLQLRAAYPNLKVVILTSFSEESLMDDFRKKGATAFVTKGEEFSTVVNVIKRVHHLPSYNNFKSNINSMFTKRELQMIPLFLAGKTSKQIGEILGVTSKAIEAIKSRLYDKTKCKNATEFVSFCTKEGLEFLGKN